MAATVCPETPPRRGRTDPNQALVRNADITDAQREHTMNDAICSHYTRGDLLQRLNAALATDGADPQRPTAAALSPYDHFHGRGLEATEDAAALVRPGPTDHLLDVGSGLGGPARYFAARFGCKVSGIDLTEEFCDVARHLTRLLGQDRSVDFHAGNALAMPFADGRFDGAYSMNVSMNIADKAALYRELHRVLKPGGWLLLSEIAQGVGGELDYPTPWAANAQASFLATPRQTELGLLAAGFEVLHLQDTAAKALDYGVRSRAAVARGERPPHRAVKLILGELASIAMAHSAQSLADGRAVPIEVLARKPALRQLQDAKA
jgi:ubiquinone/menaquinone biosynthesis C-methylase UbiE